MNKKEAHKVGCGIMTLVFVIFSIILIIKTIG